MSGKKPKLLFVFFHRYENIWRDGLWAALNFLRQDFDIQFHNLFNSSPIFTNLDYDFILGWGAFGSPADNFIRKLKDEVPNLKAKTGLCIAGTSLSENPGFYDVLFYETEWFKNYLEKSIEKKVYEDGGLITHRENLNLVHAFGINTDIFNKWEEAPIIWDWLSVGSFSYWKRHERILTKSGTRLVVGEIQKDNWQESFDIISDLLLNGVGISDMLYPTKLRNIYNCSGTVYIPADTNGGGERAVLEARACGRPVEVENDNIKLLELLNGPLYDHNYYYSRLKEGIQKCLNQN